MTTKALIESSVFFGVFSFLETSSLYALNPSGRFCKPMSKANNGAMEEPEATNPPNAMASGI